MANVTINGHDYTGVEEVLLPITDGDGEEQSFVLPPTFQSKTVSPTTSQQTVSPDSGYDGLSSVIINAIQTETASATPSESPQTITPSSGKYLTSVSVGAIQTESKSATPSESPQTVTPSSRKYLTSVSVGAISADYVGSGIPHRSSSNLTVSGATVSVPWGYYNDNYSETVASGSAGTPTATKGTVNNHSITVTPSVTNTTGYITGGTKTGSAVTVSASELVSGSQTINSNNTYDVTNLASVVVNVSGSAPSLTTLNATANGDYSPSGYDGYSAVTVAIPTYDGSVN